MHTTELAQWQHSHDFCAETDTGERGTRRVLLLTLFMMLAELVGGWKLHSMALFADGCHMGTHVAAFLITIIAYWFARRHARDARYSFGTGKVGVLGAFTSAIVLAAVAVFMAGESVNRLFHPLPIHFNEALVVASIGLAVNVVSAWLLKDSHTHADHPGHGHHHHHDLNLKAAYLHVLADAVTSLLAILALTGGKVFGWTWLDPVMGLVGSGVIAQWAYGLVRDTNAILLDKEPETTDLNGEIRRAIESDGDTRIADLHIWQVGLNQFAAIVSVVAHVPKCPADYKALLAEHEELVHLTVEVQACQPGEGSGG
jgi:cation diffusion facilitator family transporter